MSRLQFLSDLRVDSSFAATLQVFAFFIAFVAIFCTSWISKAWRKKKKMSPFPLPPGPRGLPVVGYLPFIGTHLHITFAKLGSLYGPVFKLWLGNKLCVVVSSPEAVREVVRDKDAIFANRDAPIAAIICTYGGNDIAFTDYGPEWRKLRKYFVQEMLGNASLDACYSIRKEAMQMGIKEVYRKVRKPVDIGQVVLVTLVDAVVRMVWGGSILEETQADSSGNSTFKQLLTDLMVLLGSPNVSDFFPTLARLDLQGIAKRMTQVTDSLDMIVDKAIAERSKTIDATDDNSRNGRRDLLQFLLELKNNGDSTLSMNQLKATLKDIVIGGTDTTATTVEWTISELLRHPEILKLVYDELTEVVGLDTAVEECHLPKLQYLAAVVKETHRLHPAVPLLVPRRPSQTTDIGGYSIPEGTKIFVNVWAIHRDPQLWDKPLEFRPERFLLNNTAGGNKWGDYYGNDFRYLPFGSGRRVCAGLQLAERMQMYTLASFLHSFKWHIPNGEAIDLTETFGLVLKKKVPLVAIPTPRLSNSELYA